MKPNQNVRRDRVLPARKIAAQCLLRVMQEDAYANLVLPGMLSQAKLPARDAAFATELTYGTLRQQMQLDWVLTKLVSKPLTDLDPAVLVVARLAVYQVLHTRVPDHAAIAQSVELAKELCDFGAEKFINGVGRSLVERGADKWMRDFEKIPSDLERICVTYSHPQWIVRDLAAALAAHGRDPVELEELLAAHNRQPEVSLCARPGAILPAHLADDAEYFLRCQARPGDYSEWSVIISGGDPGRIPPIRDGRAAVQDEASQLVTTALAEVAGNDRDSEWLDMCAGPGGKAGLLAAFAQHRGAHLLANEVSAHRAELVTKTLGPYRDCTTVQVGDGREIDAKSSFDRILLDAPCTGLGALRRRPESRWRRQLSDLAALVKLQAELLDRAVEILAPGGVLGYVTCSPHQQETVRQIERLLQRRDDLEVLPAAQSLDEVAMSDIGVQGTPVGTGDVVQMWPHLHGTDAMFLALLRKK